MRSASIEWLCAHAGILRLHQTADGKLGDPWDWACAVYNSGPGEVTLKAAEKAPPEPRMDSIRAIADRLAAEGVELVYWERKDEDGKDRRRLKFKTRR